jgi:hypothetical protein
MKNNPSTKITKGLADAIPLGPHPHPHAEWIRVRLDFVQKAIDMIDWLEKGNVEWREEALRFKALYEAHHDKRT